MRFRGRDIRQWPIPRSPASYNADFEAVLAGVWAGDLLAFLRLDGDEKAYVVAAYRSAMMLEAVSSHEAAREAKRH